MKDNMDEDPDVSVWVDVIQCFAIIGLWLLLILVVNKALAAPPEKGTTDYDMLNGHGPWITSQTDKFGTNCCSISDGRTAEIRKRNNHWEVFYSKEHWGKNATETWLPVPDSAILDQQSPISFPVAWINSGRVLCLALASGY